MGHAIGDQYLKLMADRLLGVSRKQNLLGRRGGDELVMAMAGMSDPRMVSDTIARLAEPIHLGVTNIQGYFFAHPMSSSELVNWLEHPIKPS